MRTHAPPAHLNHHTVSDRTDKAEKRRDKAPPSCERHTMFMRAMCDAWTAIFRLTAIAKPMNTATRNGREKPEHRDMANDEMVGWFKSAPKGSRHERMLWATRNIAHLTGATEGGAYKRLLIALIEAEGRLDPREFKDCA
jgi:hypothetical protein